ncbi:MAG: group II intron reverse transcriptase/maturase [Chloroflexota bacterium]
MTKAPISLQDLRRKIYAKAKAEPLWRFWGLYVHVCKMETLREAYQLAKQNDGAPGIDGVTFAAIEARGVDRYLEQIRDELITRRYRPIRNRRKEIPKGNGKVRVLQIPSIRDRVVQGALKLILEPIFEADFQPGSYGYRPQRSAHQAVEHVSLAILQGKTRVIDVDLRAFFDNVRHHLLFEKVSRRVNDDAVMHLLKLVVKAAGTKGVPQGGVISPLLSNIYLNEVDEMLERAIKVTCRGRRTHLAYARFADDLVILVDGDPGCAGLLRKVQQRLLEELAKLQVAINEEKSRVVDLANRKETFGFLGFDFRRERSRRGKWYPLRTPKTAKRTQLMRKLKPIFRRFRSQPIREVLRRINPILRGWVTYFAVGNSTKCFARIRYWVEKKVRRHLMRARQRKGFGWKRWSSVFIYQELGLFDGYRVSWRSDRRAALPAQ